MPTASSGCGGPYAVASPTPTSVRSSKTCWPTPTGGPARSPQPRSLPRSAARSRSITGRCSRRNSTMRHELPGSILDPVAAALQLAPATGAVVGDDVLEHGGEGGRVDRFALSDGHGAGSRIFVAAGDDPLGIGDDAAVVEEHVDVVPGRQP